jgi:tetratricopeptide (TPR) repeat protein
MAAQYGLALEAAAAAGAPAGERWELHEARGGVRELLGQFEPAREDLEAALGLARTAGDREAEARLLGSLGALWGGHRDYARGLELAEQAVEVAARADCLREEADARLRVGVMRINLAQVRIGRREAEAGLSLFGRLHDEPGQARALDVLAMTGLCGGSNRAAVAHAREAIARLRVLGDRVTEASAWAPSAISSPPWATSPPASPLAGRASTSAGQSGRRQARHSRTCCWQKRG